MKQVLFIIICTLLLNPNMASAHTELTSSNPAAGQVVTEDIKEIVLTFAGEIEALSTMKLFMEGQEVPFNVEVQEKQLIGKLPAPLDNGSYVVKWNIAGVDGHLITGEIPFSVQLEQEVKQEQTTETKEPITTDKEDPDTKSQTKTDASNEPNNKPFANTTQLIISVVVILILGIGLYLLFGRKK